MPVVRLWFFVLHRSITGWRGAGGRLREYHPSSEHSVRLVAAPRARTAEMEHLPALLRLTSGPDRHSSPGCVSDAQPVGASSPIPRFLETGYARSGAPGPILAERRGARLDSRLRVGSWGVACPLLCAFLW